VRNRPIPQVILAVAVLAILTYVCAYYALVKDRAVGSLPSGEAYYLPVYRTGGHATEVFFKPISYVDNGIRMWYWRNRLGEIVPPRYDTDESK
jgi:hypothetical protein